MKKVILTGGPRSAKTTIQEYLKTELPKNDIHPIMGPELATLIFGAGVDWSAIGPNEWINRLFQIEMIKLQMNIENAFIEMATLSQKASGNKTILIFDRGILDNFAYLPEIAHQGMLRTINHNFETLKNRYDLILHLETSANDDQYEELMKDNPVRHETTQQAAKEACCRTYETWKNGGDGPQHQWIPYLKDLDKKKQIVLSSILGIL